MVTMIEQCGRKVPAVVFSHVGDLNGVRDLRDALNEVLETCLSSEENKDNTKAMSLWFLQQVITDLTKAVEKSDCDGQG